MVTREEYQRHTEITSPDEARDYLWKLKISFCLVFIFMIVVQVMNFMGNTNEIFTMMIWLYILSIVMFVTYCSRVIRLTKKVNRADVIIGLVFAPISWIWFYPELVKPLKIILGELEPPEVLELRKFPSPEVARAANIRFWGKFVLISLSLVAFLTAVIIALLIFIPIE